MDYIKACIEQKEEIYQLVQTTILTVYPRYYPSFIVDFFASHHSIEHIEQDIRKGCTGVVFADNKIVGTGSYEGNHITRVYVSPAYQRQGIGSFIMDQLEQEIVQHYETVNLDASLPASHLYEKRGYQTIRHQQHLCNESVLVYEIMEKRLPAAFLQYHGKTFVPKTNSENGEVSGQTVFSYYQEGQLLWANYAGGDIIKGFLLGKVQQDNSLDFHYQHVNAHGEVRIGKCHSIPVVTLQGLELHEQWTWLNGDTSSGTSVLIEV